MKGRGIVAERPNRQTPAGKECRPPEERGGHDRSESREERFPGRLRTDKIKGTEVAETLHHTDFVQRTFGGSKPKPFLNKNPFRIDDPEPIFIKMVSK